MMRTAIVEAVRGRRAVAIACTHGHNDHINVAPQLAESLDARIGLHPSDRMLWTPSTRRELPTSSSQTAILSRLRE